MTDSDTRLSEHGQGVLAAIKSYNYKLSEGLTSERMIDLSTGLLPDTVIDSCKSESDCLIILEDLGSLKFSFKKDIIQRSLDKGYDHVATWIQENYTSNEE